MKSAGVSNSERRSGGAPSGGERCAGVRRGCLLNPVGNNNSRAAFGNNPRHPPGRRRRGYAGARVELCRLLDDRWRVYYKDELLLETAHPTTQAPVDFVDTRDPAGTRACVKSEIGQSVYLSEFSDPQLCAVWLIDHCAARFSALIEISN